MTDLQRIVDNQREYFLTGQTRPLDFRLQALIKLRTAIRERTEEILAALHQDLRKPAQEAYASDIATVLSEIDYTVKRLPRWSRTKRLCTPLALAPAASKVIYEPYGVCLVIAPWNYPFGTCLHPLVHALAAGNCAVLKPSRFAPATSAIIADIIRSIFPQEYCTALHGEGESSREVLRQRFDFICFTGSPEVGKIVMEAAARHLTPVLLELGGKSPCIVDRDIDMETTARRIVWAKFFNAGQTCVAPDYLLVPEDGKALLLDELAQTVRRFYGQDPQVSPDYARIINERHFDRLTGLLDSGQTVCGGRHDRNDLYIEPVILDNVAWESPIMGEEIFGPILPVLTYKSIGEVIDRLKRMEKPLALYAFSRNRKWAERIMTEISFGGGCVNAGLMQFVNKNLPFGGVGNSGMGCYHGHYGFEAFSHRKGILDKRLRPDLSLLYPPYGNNLKWLKRLLG